MSQDPKRPVELTTCATESEAAILIATLDAEGITAQMVGGLTSGLRAEAPGGVTVLVHEENLEKAKEVLNRF